MRVVLIVLILLSGISFAQVEGEVRNRLMMLANADSVRFQLDSTGISNLPKVDYHCCEEGESSVFWHVQDLNNDNLEDLIYSGSCQPYDQSAVFLNTGATLEKVIDCPGKLLSADVTDTEMRLYVFRPGCCCENYNHFMEVTIGADNTIEQKIIEYHVETEINVSKFSEKWSSGILRTTPAVNDSLYQDPCFSVEKVGNQILTISKEKVTVFDSKQGWDLVLFEKDENYSVIGWIKSD